MTQYLNDEAMQAVVGGMDFLPTFLVTAELSPQGTKAVDAPVAALGGAQKAIGNILANVGDIKNISSPYAPV